MKKDKKEHNSENRMRTGIGKQRKSDQEEIEAAAEKMRP